MRILVVIVYLMILLAIPVLIGVYVYNDAKSRGMNASLWTLLAILAPSLIGFIIYMLVRGSYSNMRCPRCNANVDEKYVVCPSCGTKLKRTCPNCETPVENGWRVCPYCAYDLSSEQYNYNVEPPVRKEDKSIWKILIAIIIIPIAVIILLAFLFMGNISGDSMSMGMGSLSSDYYIENGVSPVVSEWLLECGDDMDTAYVLQKASENEEESFCLVYVPCASSGANSSIGSGASLFGSKVKIELEPNGIDSGIDMYYISTYGDDLPKVEVYYDGKELELEITETDVDIPIIHGYDKVYGIE